MNDDGGAATALERARAAVDAAQHQPQAALDSAVELLAANGGLSPEAEATARWAAGLASRELNDLAAADDFLTAAAGIADAAGDVQLAGGIRISRALVLAYLGRADEGLAELDGVLTQLDGAGRARAQMQRALILQRLGRLDEAITGFGQSLPGLVAAGDRVAEVRLLVNRGIALTYRNRLPEADTDLVEARRIATELGQSMQVAACSHNLGFLHGRRGDLPQSLTWFDRAAAEYSALGVDSSLSAVLLADRAEVLMDAGLGVEAVEAARQAVGLLSRSANTVQVAEARLMLARAALAVGDGGVATREAVLAFDAFTAQERTTWATLARYIMLNASRPERPGALTPEDIDQLADDLAESGWSLEAATTRIIAGARALDAGDRTTAERMLAAGARARKSGGAVYRSGGWYAQALRWLARGDRRKARAAVRTGLRILDEHRGTLGDADLRAHAAAHGERLAALLVSMAVADGKAGGILAAAESWRASGVAVSARPPDHPALAERLSALRARAALRRAGAVPEPDRETARLETEIRDLVRVLPGGPGRAPDAAGVDREPGSTAGSTLDAAEQPTTAAFDRRAVAGRLGDRLLVEWVLQDGDLIAVWLVDSHAHWARLGRAAAVEPAIHTLRMCLHRLAWGGGSARSLHATARALADAAAFLEQSLLGPVTGAAERELVLVPTGDLHRIPWAALSQVRASPFVVAPSARSWLNADRTPRRSVSLLAAAGPGLPGAADEVARIGRLYPGGTVLDPEQATVTAVLEQLGLVSIAHLATHGTFRADNPQFSSLALADGDLTVYDLQRVPQVPDTLVIAACDTATSAIRPGDELLGLSAALLSLGARSVVAPSVPVSDAATSTLMVALQRRLLSGDRVPVALHSAIQESIDLADPAGVAVAQSFVTLGA